MKKFLPLLLVSSSLLGAGISYSIDFEGLEDNKALRAVRSSSQLVALKKKPPSSINALRFRAESDLPDIMRVLRAFGYFEADAQVKIEDAYPNYHVVVEITPGPLYRIGQYRIQLESETPDDKIVCPDLTLDNIGIHPQDPATTQRIYDSELCALHILSENGYPLASIQERQIIADGKTKMVRVLLIVSTGPLSRFGHTAIGGNTSVRDSLIQQQVQWGLEEIYDSCLVEGTQKALMDTGLFSSVYITHQERLDQEGLLPIKIDVTETKHKSISLGASYQTTYGAGVSFGWENRNVGGLGRRLLLQADIAQRGHYGIASYQVPNFICKGQSYTIQAQAAHESITPYKMQSYSFFNRFDREWGCYYFFSIGPKVEYMIVSSSVDNGNFLLVEGPLYLRWTNVCDFLNPTSGFRIDYRGTPTVNIKDVSDFYYSQTLMLSSYLPLWRDEIFILAQKLTVGTIFSNGIGAIPVPKRFFGGSEDNLRGYKYLTVSPLDKENDDKPIGGRSAIFYSLEPRFRLTRSFGIVPFFDIGNVYLDSLPTLKGKWRKSTGIGIRYYSFVGPLRLDVAFPLNRREGIDPHWWIFVSLGQTF